MYSSIRRTLGVGAAPVLDQRNAQQHRSRMWPRPHAPSANAREHWLLTDLSHRNGWLLHGPAGTSAAPSPKPSRVGRPVKVCLTCQAVQSYRPETESHRDDCGNRAMNELMTLPKSAAVSVTIPTHQLSCYVYAREKSTSCNSVTSTKRLFWA